ncbi:MAG: phosphatase PAP2 family protein [Phycisphaerae bacterium]
MSNTDRKNAVSKLINHIRNTGLQEMVLLVVIVLVAGAVWAFAEIADEVIEGDTHEVDRAIILALRNPDDRADPIGPEWVEEAVRDYTALGGIGVSALLTLVVLIYLLLMRHRRGAVLVLLSVGGGILLSFLLKMVFARPRPELVQQYSHVVTTSFPSGHTMISTVTFLTLGVLLARLHSRKHMKSFFVLVALLGMALVGFSRVYLGVHWPTDVLAGWAAGAAWAMLCWLVTYGLQRRGKMENVREENGEE